MEKNFNKTELTKVCRFILRNDKTVVEEKHQKFLLKYVFPNHPDWEVKRGCGIDHIEIRPDGYGGKCFYLFRTDNTSTDISFTESISPKKDRLRSDIEKACRTAIYEPVIKPIRDSIILPFTCPETGEVIYDLHLIHIDHYDKTFKEVVDEWIKDKDIVDLYRKTRSSSYDGSTVTYFDDQKVIEDFIDFHNRNTHLRVVSRKANLSEYRKNKRL